MRILVLIVALGLAAHAYAQPPGVNLPYQSPYPPEPPSSQPALASSLAQDMLYSHNAVRARVGVPPLTWSERLAQTAQDWADYLVATNRLFHSPDNRYGENLY